jgi:hypothetical protein
MNIKKHENLAIAFVIVVFLLLCNVAYYLATNWQNFSIIKKLSPSANETISLKTYSSSKMGFELKYPSAWVAQESEDRVEINPQSKEGSDIYFSAEVRNDFKTLDDIKKTLAPDLPTTSIQVGGASGFEYTDSDFHETIWLLHSDKIYLIRTFPRIEQSNQILATVKFLD